MIGYFDDLSAMIAGGSRDPSAVDAIGSRHGVDVVGPVPVGYV